MEQVEDIKDNVMDQQKGLYILNLLRQKRKIKKLLDSKIEVTDNKEFNKLENDLNIITNEIVELSKKQPKIVQDFYDLIMDENSITI